MVNMNKMLNTKERKIKESRIFNVINVILLVIISIICFMPFLNVVSVALSSAGNDVNFVPEGFTTFNFKYVWFPKRP